MQKKKFFKAEEINGASEWVLDSQNSVLSVATLKKLHLAEGGAQEFVMHDKEALVVPVFGELEFEFAGKKDVAQRFDAIYLTKGETCVIKAICLSDVLICEAAAKQSYQSVLIRRKDVTPVVSGSGCYTRNVWNMVSPGVVEAERLILGYCEGTIEGGWTGWPPHEHSGNLEEIYYYYDMCGPMPGVLQMHYDDMDGKIEVDLAKNGDVFAISSGYHPIVALPGTLMKNLWFMAANKPEDRDFGVVRVDSTFQKKEQAAR